MIKVQPHESSYVTHLELTRLAWKFLSRLFTIQPLTMDLDSQLGTSRRCAARSASRARFRHWVRVLLDQSAKQVFLASSQ